MKNDPLENKTMGYGSHGNGEVHSYLCKNKKTAKLTTEKFSQVQNLGYNPTLFLKLYSSRKLKLKYAQQVMSINTNQQLFFFGKKLE